MNSAEIQEAVYQWAVNNQFDAPYGVIVGEGKNQKGTKHKNVTFGRCRTLDAMVSIFNRNFIVVVTNRHGKQVFKSYDELMIFLNTL